MAKDKEKETPVVESMADKRAREEEEARGFKKKYPQVINTIDTLLKGFSGKERGLIDGLLDDFAPSDPKKKPGISARSVFKLIGFAFRNPGKIGDLISIARNPAILQNKTFQQEVLKSENTWKFVGMLGEENRLPKIGQALAHFGVKEFEKGNILDQDSLVTLNPLIKEKDSRDVLKKIATQFMDPAFDQNKNINEIVDLMLKPGPVANYLHQKKDSLKKYAVATFRYMMQPEVKYYEELQRKGIPLDEQAIKIGKRLSNDLKDQMASFGIKLQDVEKLADLIPILMDKPEDLKKFYDSYAKGDFIALGKEIVAMSKETPAIKEFLDNNKDIFKNVLVEAVKSTPILQQYGIKDPALVDLFTPLLTGDNAEQVKGMVEKYQKGQWPELALELCQLIEKDPEFKKQLENNRGNLGAIVEKVVENIPFVKQFTGQMKVKDLVSNILKDPKGLQSVIESYQKGGKEMVWGGIKFLANKVLDSEFRGGVVQAVGTFFLGDGSKRQKLVDHLGKTPPSDNPKTRINLNDLANSALKELQPNNEKEKKEFEELEELVKTNQLFSGVTISNKMENMDISANFVNSTLNNVSFNGSDLKNCSFLNTKLNKVDFSGATIDGTTLQSMELQLRKKSISLKGVKIVGDIPPGTNLSGIDFSGADLSGVTSMKGVNIKDANLSSAELPSKKEVFESAYNLQNAKMPEKYVSKEMLSKNEDLVLKQMLDLMVIKAKETLNEVKDEKAFREEITRIYKSDTPIGQKLREDLLNDPHIISMKGFPKGSFKNCSELANADSAITTLYNSKDDVKSIETKLYANIIADQISEDLFKKGDNRGADAVLIREVINESLTKFTKDNPGIKPQEIIENPNFTRMIENVTEHIRSKTSYTTVGAIWSGGIYLKENSAKNSELTEFIAHELDKNMSMSEKDMQQIEILTNKIAVNLFGKNHGRKDSAKLIQESLLEVFNKMKKDDKDIDVASYLAENMDKIVGDKKSGLTGLYYANKNSTTTGLVTGWVGIEGIYLQKEKILGEEFIAKLDQNIQNGRKPLEEMSKSNDSLTSKKPTEQMSKFNESIESIPETSLSESELKKIERLTNKIVENLFGKGHARKKDGELIKESLQEAFKELKKQNNNVDITGIIGQNMNKLVGKVNPGYLSTSGDGLSLLYYKNSSYTTAGLTTGGVYLDSKKIQAKEFAVNLKSHIEKDVGKEMKKKGIVKDVNVDKSYIGQNTKNHKSTPNLTKRESTRQVGN